MLDSRDFDAKYVSVYMAKRIDKTRIGAGLACGALWVVSAIITVGDRVVTPNGGGKYCVGTVTSGSHYAPSQLHTFVRRFSTSYPHP